MAEPSSLPQLVRFGVFELDLRSGELTKRGIKIRLADQPFRVLVLLLERPGEVVTREQLCSALWPEETFVEFEHSLNAAVAKLRQALGDSADNPRFVETIARRGYRWISSTETALPASAEAVAIPGSSPKTLESDAVQKPRSSLAGYKRSFRLLAAGAVLIGVGTEYVRHRVQVALPSNFVLNRLTSDAGLATEPALSRDGKLLAFASDRSGKGNLDVWVHQVSGTPYLQLTHGDGDSHEPDFSPDGTQVVFRYEGDGGGIYSVPTLGGDARRLMEGGHSPRFSPDGQWIAGWFGAALGSVLSATAGAVFVVQSTGGKARVLDTPGLPNAGNPIWSPDGKHLLVYGSRTLGAEDDWWVIPLDGGSAVPTGAFAVLRKQGFSLSYPAEVPRVGGWSADSLLFSAKLGDSVNVWRIKISPGSWQVSGVAQRISSGSSLEVYASFAPDGRVVYASLAKATNIWSLPLLLNEAVQTGKQQQLTTGMFPDDSPSLSADGKRLAFISSRSGQEEVWLKDLETGKETPLTTTGSVKAKLIISYDGSRIAYTTGMPAGVIYVVSTAGGQPEKVCGDCGWLMEWSHDGKKLIYDKITQNGMTIYALDLWTKRDTLFLERKGHDIYQPRFSPDGRWIVFVEWEPFGLRAFVAPLRDGRGPPETEWILLPTAKADRFVWTDKPRWSPDGNRVYYVSTQDGFRCIWSQRLNPATKQPIGTAGAVSHFHNARLSMANVGWGELEMDAAKDKLVFNLGELTGNIWSAKPQ